MIQEFNTKADMHLKGDSAQMKLKEAPPQQVSSTSTSHAVLIPWDLHYWANEKLTQLGLKALIELCKERDIKPGKRIADCVQLLIDWKAEHKQLFSHARKTPSPPPATLLPAAVVVSLATPTVTNPHSPTASKLPAGIDGRPPPSHPPPAAPSHLVIPKVHSAASAGPIAAGVTTPAAVGDISASAAAAADCVSATAAPAAVGDISASAAAAADCVSTATATTTAAAAAAAADAGSMSINLTLVSWNIKFLSKNSEGWGRRKSNLTETLRSLSPHFIVVQELMSGDGSRTDGGKQAAADIQRELGANWAQTFVNHLSLSHEYSSFSHLEQVL
jgi:hypothetical protein